MKTVALIIESCQAPKTPTLLDIFMQMVNTLPETESNGPLRPHKPLHLLKPLTLPGIEPQSGGGRD